MNFLNYNPYGFMTLPQSNPIPMRQSQPVPQIQPPQMMQINQMQNMNDFATAFNQQNQKGGLKDQIQGQLGAAAGGAIAQSLGLPPEVGAQLGKGLFSGEKRQPMGLIQAPQLSNPMSFSFDNVPQVADGSAQYVQMLRGLLA